MAGHTKESRIPALGNASVRMRDRRRVEEILQGMRTVGLNTIQVISDFDMTLTRFKHKGKLAPTSHNILIHCFSEEGKEKHKKLYEKYYPISIDSSRTIEEKLPLMVEWWTSAHTLIVQQKIRKDQLALAVQESGAMLRDGYQSFFDLLHQHSVPLLIFSAGLGNMLEEVIRQAEVFHPNVNVFSNYMVFDETGVIRAFKGELIHIYNKGEGALLNTGHFKELRSRPNVVLLGDSLGDLTMADGVQDVESVLKIGFLNDKVDERQQSYLDSYDIVILEDETLEVPNAILDFLVAN